MEKEKAPGKKRKKSAHLELAQEQLRCVDAGKVDAAVLPQALQNLCGFVFSQATVVNHNGVKAIADGLVHENGSDGGVNTT